MRKRGRPPFGNAYALGYVEAARQVSDRIYNKAGPCRVWMLPNGDLIVRHHGEGRFDDPGDANLIGTYTAYHPTKDIADDLMTAMHERAQIAA